MNSTARVMMQNTLKQLLEVYRGVETELRRHVSRLYPPGTVVSDACECVLGVVLDDESVPPGQLRVMQESGHEFTTPVEFVRLCEEDLPLWAEKQSEAIRRQAAARRGSNKDEVPTCK